MLYITHLGNRLIRAQIVSLFLHRLAAPIFADSLAAELITLTGDAASGFVANVQIGIAV